MDPFSSRLVHKGSHADLISLSNQLPLSKCLLNDAFALVLVSLRLYGDLELRLPMARQEDVLNRCFLHSQPQFGSIETVSRQ